MSTLASPLQARLDQVKARIDAAARAVSRDPRAIALIAVSKTFGAEQVLAAIAAGQRQFGENYVQEAVEKMTRVRAALSATPDTRLQWHFIGPIQSNKTRAIAENFDWVQSVDRLRIAERLSAQRPADMPPLDVLLEVNISGEASKSGVATADASSLAAAVAGLPRLRLRGLMAIPAPDADARVQRAAFERVRQLFESLRAGAAGNWDTLSMGMSADLEAAIAAGSTMVRVGTAIFGARA